jgi:tRNA pseudouridine55 synthase
LARRRRGRPIDGILVLDKPAGQSSNGVLQAAKRLYYAAKAGHTGSLDPLATGVLPLCFGEATKFSQYLLDSDKTYRSTFVLGVKTTTGDAEGEVVAREDAGQISEAQVAEALEQFRGEITQVPSMFSALKHNGQPLYKLAREGKEVERKQRQVTVYKLLLEAFRSAGENGEYPEVDVFVHCSKGTYIRSIAEDLGEALGCGAHVSVLRRVKAGPFAEAQAISLEQLQSLRDGEAFTALDELLQPVESAIGHLPELTLVDDVAYYLLQGQPVLVPQAPTEGVVRLRHENGRFLGVGEIQDDGRVAPRRLIATNQSQ